MAVIPDASRMPPRCSHGVSTFEAITFMTHEIVEATTNPDSVLVEMPPVVGANVQCNGVRDSGTDHPIACAACGQWPGAPPGHPASHFNPDEVSDSAACGTPASYSTTGAPDGNYRNAIFLNSRGACTVTTGVAAAAPRPPPTGNACLPPDRRRVWILPAEPSTARCNRPIEPARVAAESGPPARNDI
jgi:hypothetical protein